MLTEDPITFEALSYALFDVGANAVLTTEFGNLAIFSTKSMATIWAGKSKRNVKVIPVQITRGSEQ